MRSTLRGLLAVGLLGCGTPRTAVQTETAATRTSAPLPFIQDDYPRALAQARARGVPLFIDAGAPWCHACVTMKQSVLTDEAIKKLGPRFVWLEINTDLPINAALQEQFPTAALPTFFIVDPREEKALLSFVGDAPVLQFERFLEDGEQSFHGNIQGPEVLLARSEALQGEGKLAESVELLQQALAEAPQDWGSRERVEQVLKQVLTEAPSDWKARGSTLEALLGVQRELAHHEACVHTALEQLPLLPHAAPWADSAAAGLDCALNLPEQTAGAAEQQAALEAQVREALSPHIPLAAEDRSGMYMALVMARAHAGDAAGKKAILEQWLTFLEGEAERAPNPTARLSVNVLRTAAASMVGEHQRAIPALEQSERELPDNSEPPMRLASLYRKVGRLDDALAASSRALPKLEGIYRLSALKERAEIYVARNERDQAVRALRDALDYAKALPPKSMAHNLVVQVEKRLADLTPK